MAFVPLITTVRFSEDGTRVARLMWGTCASAQRGRDTRAEEAEVLELLDALMRDERLFKPEVMDAQPLACPRLQEVHRGAGITIYLRSEVAEVL
ncbi:MAG TPA: hypothetical protein VN680_16725 [Burkholderiaceae bacterium]|jgi:hypothetical protein|nr:hypothetical protein [Burkholderiaceae bacterium]